MPFGGGKEFDERLDGCFDLPSLVLRNLKRFGDRTFLVDGLEDVKVTFRQVHDDAVVYALALRKMGVGEGTQVAFITDSTIDAFKFCVGVWLAGGSVCPMNPSLLPGDIAQLLETCNATFVYCDAGRTTLFEECKQIVMKDFTTFTNSEQEGWTSLKVLLSYDSSLSDEISSFTTCAYDPDNHCAYVLFTSGTTGVSKGVMLSSYASLLNGSRIYQSDGTTFVTTPFSWISNPAAFVNCILGGSELVFPRVKCLPGTTTADPYHIPRCIEKYRPQKWMTAPSTILDMCYLPNIGEYDLSSITHLSVGGSAILAVQKKFICETLFKRNIVQERYGSTEVGFLTREWLCAPPDFDDPKCGSIGPPSPGVEWKIVDRETGRELGINEVGEILVKSDAIMQRYINKETPKTYSKDEWYAIGDNGCCDEDGWLYFKSRSKEILKYRGYHIVPGDLEIILLQHPDLMDACVVGVPHPIDGEWPTAFVVKKEDSSLSESALTTFFNGQVSDDKKLRGGVFFKKRLPRSTVGKVMKKNLVEEAASTLSKENHFLVKESS